MLSDIAPSDQSAHTFHSTGFLDELTTDQRAVLDAIADGEPPMSDAEIDRHCEAEQRRHELATVVLLMFTHTARRAVESILSYSISQIA